MPKTKPSIDAIFCSRNFFSWIKGPIKFDNSNTNKFMMMMVLFPESQKTNIYLVGHSGFTHTFKSFGTQTVRRNKRHSHRGKTEKEVWYGCCLGKTTKVCIEKIMLVTLANHLTKILNHKIFFKFSTALEFLAGPRIPKTKWFVYCIT